MKGIDSATKLTAATAAAIKAAGYDFAGRYMVPERGTLKWKALTKTECEAISGAGLDILTVWETTADRVKGGAEAGRTDGKEAGALANALGMPESGIIYFAVDYDAPESDFPAIKAYLQAAKGSCGRRIGVYGGYRVIEAACKWNTCAGYWQCVAWSYGKKSAHLTVYQAEWDKSVAGIGVDINECPDGDKAGLWSYREDDMTGAEIYDKLRDYLREQPVPEWAKAELEEAVAMGITDGTRPMELIPRYQAAIMAKRAAEK